MTKELDHAAIALMGDWLSSRGKSANTIKAYSTDLQMFLLWTGQSVPQADFDLEAAAWLNATRAAAKPKTTNRRLTSLKTFARWAKWPLEELSDYSTPDPGRPVPHPIPEGIPGVLAMIEAANNIEGKALIAMCGLAGLRIHEALSISPLAVDPDRKLMTVRGKGDKTRVIPLGVTPWAYIFPVVVDALLHRKPFIVSLPDRTARDWVTRYGRRAGLSKPVASHDLRATFATAAYRKSKDIRAVQELLGHSSSVTTEGYIEVRMEDMRAAGDVADIV
jgi:site-specific recombinase XerD